MRMDGTKTGDRAMGRAGVEPQMGTAMTREERIQDIMIAIMIAMRDACYQPLGQHLLRRLAECLALDGVSSCC
jgi:hypothetical protein